MWWKILLIIFAVLFLILWQNIHVIVSFDGEFQLIAGLGLVRLNIMKLINKMKNKPKKEKPKKKKKEKEEEKEEKPKKEKSNVFKDVWDLRGVDGAIDLLSEFASLLAKFSDSIAKHFVIRNLVLHYAVHGDDAADTALKFGKISAAVFTSLGLIAGASQVKKHDIQLIPDYLGTDKTQTVKIHISYKILSLLGVVLIAGKDFLAIMKREGKINARIRARSKMRAQKAREAALLKEKSES